MMFKSCLLVFTAYCGVASSLSLSSLAGAAGLVADGNDTAPVVSPCFGKDDLFIVDKWSLTPKVPVSGDHGTLVFNGEVLDQIDEGHINIDLKVGGIIPLNFHIPISK
eukprot:Awhi_evm1s15185